MTPFTNTEITDHIVNYLCDKLWDHLKLETVKTAAASDTAYDDWVVELRDRLYLWQDVKKLSDDDDFDIEDVIDDPRIAAVVAEMKINLERIWMIDFTRLIDKVEESLKDS
jgi:hypothetical protein